MTPPKKGRVTKVVLVDSGIKPIIAGTQQEAEDPFTYGGVHGLQEPPYSPDQLNSLAELHSTHGSALEQKTMDIIATGWEWEKKEDSASDEDRDKLDEWFTDLADPKNDESTAEILNAAWMDVETLGYGGIEIARDGNDKVQKIYSLPAHTFRFHKSGQKLAQGRVGRRSWFKRWQPGDERVVDKKSGELYEKGLLPQDRKRGNEVLILRRPTRRKSWYGVPGYVSAIGWIYLSNAARDDNIQFFNNRREPRWAVILKNIEQDADLEQMLKDAFTSNLSEPHRNVFIPIDGDGDIHFEKLTNDVKDISFDKLQERSSGEILLAHRIPPDRLGAVRVGPLGGNTAMAASRVYKEAVVSTSQSLLAERMNRFIESEYGETTWKWIPHELDLTEEAEDTATVTNGWINGLYRLDEARKKMKMPPVGGDEGEMFFHQFTAGSDQQGVMAANNAARSGASLGAMVAARRAMMGGVAASQTPETLLRDVDTHVRAILIQHREEQELSE